MLRFHKEVYISFINDYRNASNNRPGRLLKFLRKRGRLFEGTFNREGVFIQKIQFQPNILFFLATKISKITIIMNNQSSILTSSSSFSSIIVRLGAASMISSSVCVKRSSFSSQVGDKFI